MSFSTLKDGVISYSILNPAGAEVLSENAGNINSGDHSYTIDVSELPDGVYYLHLKTGAKQTIRKIVLMK